jgi:hypothetical protein
MAKELFFKEKLETNKCEKCGVKITTKNWGRIDFVKGTLLCRKCLLKKDLDGVFKKIYSKNKNRGNLH